jgi:biotin carboxyl carrier protein
MALPGGFLSLFTVDEDSVQFQVLLTVLATLISISILVLFAQHLSPIERALTKKPTNDVAFRLLVQLERNARTRPLLAKLADADVSLEDLATEIMGAARIPSRAAKNTFEAEIYPALHDALFRLRDYERLNQEILFLRESAYDPANPAHAETLEAVRAGFFCAPANARGLQLAKEFNEKHQLHTLPSSLGGAPISAADRTALAANRRIAALDGSVSYDSQGRPIPSLLELTRRPLVTREEVIQTWADLGFQRADTPWTDFRSAGMLVPIMLRLAIEHAPYTLRKVALDSIGPVQVPDDEDEAQEIDAKIGSRDNISSVSANPEASASGFDDAASVVADTVVADSAAASPETAAAATGSAAAAPKPNPQPEPVQQSGFWRALSGRHVKAPVAGTVKEAVARRAAGYPFALAAIHVICFLAGQVRDGNLAHVLLRLPDGASRQDPVDLQELVPVFVSAMESFSAFWLSTAPKSVMEFNVAFEAWKVIWSQYAEECLLEERL